MNDISCIEVEAQKPAQYSIIWLHGLGADGHDFVPIVKELQLPTELAIRFIFPHAPIMAVTINNGHKMRAWFDIKSLGDESAIDTVGVEEAILTIKKLIDREMSRGIPPANIILAGFSQGASLALITGMRYPHQVAGVIALSGFLPKNAVQKKDNTHQLSIFLAHGLYDAVVPYALGKMTDDNLREAGYVPEWHSYPMTHSVCAEEIMDISKWITQIW